MHKLNPPAQPALSLWLLSGCVGVFLMVLIGGLTRLTHSGLSMVEWNLIMGSLPPLNETAWMAAFEQYKQFPEYRQLHSHFDLQDFKAIFWWEYSHRLLGRLLGLLFLLPFLYFYFTGKISRSLLPKLLVLFGLGALQAFLGWFMVKSGLADKPYVSHYRLALHLFTAFITFGYTFWLALETWCGKSKKASQAPKVLFRLLLAFITVLGLQVIYGALVAGLKAGYAYNTFPKMGDRWIPEAIGELQPFYLNFLEGQAGVQFVHRLLAYLLLLLASLLFFHSRKIYLSRLQQGSIQGLLAVVLLQAVLGIFTLLLFVPISLGVLHQAGAFVVLSVSLFLLYQLKYATGLSNTVAHPEEAKTIPTPSPVVS